MEFLRAEPEQTDNVSVPETPESSGVSAQKPDPLVQSDLSVFNLNQTLKNRSEVGENTQNSTATDPLAGSADPLDGTDQVLADAMSQDISKENSQDQSEAGAIPTETKAADANVPKNRTEQSEGKNGNITEINNKVINIKANESSVKNENSSLPSLSSSPPLTPPFLAFSTSTSTTSSTTSSSTSTTATSTSSTTSTWRMANSSTLHNVSSSRQLTLAIMVLVNSMVT